VARIRGREPSVSGPKRTPSVRIVVTTESHQGLGECRQWGQRTPPGRHRSINRPRLTYLETWSLGSRRSPPRAGANAGEVVGCPTAQVGRWRDERESPRANGVRVLVTVGTSGLRGSGRGSLARAGAVVAVTRQDMLAPRPLRRISGSARSVSVWPSDKRARSGGWRTTPSPALAASTSLSATPASQCAWSTRTLAPQISSPRWLRIERLEADAGLDVRSVAHPFGFQGRCLSRARRETYERRTELPAWGRGRRG
jgi:hypothetical protein